MLKVSNEIHRNGNSYRYNENLWCNIEDYLCTKIVTIIDKISVSRQTYSRWKHSCDISVDALLKLCNAFNMRVSWFIAPSGLPFNVPKKHRQLKNEWNFTFNEDKMLSYFGDEGIEWRTASRLTNHSRASLKKWCGKNATVSQLIYMLNTFSIPITDIISDSTLVDIDCTTSTMRKEILSMRLEINKLRNKLREYQIKENRMILVAEDENNKYV